MEHIVPPSLGAILTRGRWQRKNYVKATSNFEALDAVFSRVMAYRYSTPETVCSSGIPFIFSSHPVWRSNLWDEVVNQNKIRADTTLYRKLVERSLMIPINPKSKFLDTWAIREHESYHKFLLGRSSECMIYGYVKPSDWFSFFSVLSDGKLKELRYIAGLVKVFKGPPFIVKRADNSNVSELKGFYNIQNIIESLLNVSNLRFSLSHRILNLWYFDEGKKCLEKIDLFLILDEIAETLCVSPKIIVEELRKFLNLMVRISGSLADEQRTFKMKQNSMHSKNWSSDVEVIDFKGKEFFHSYMNTSIMKSCLESGFKVLEKYKMIKLNRMCWVYLRTSLCYTKKTEFIACGSFLMSIMALAGYGRALNFSSSPRSAPEKEDVNGIGNRLKNNILQLHKEAVRAGFHPVTPALWMPTCVGYWKSTSAGMGAINLKVNVKGTNREVKIRKKLGVGMAWGNSLFKRSELRKPLTRNNPGSVGYRDVPYKATRAVYVIKLPTLHAQIAVIQHLVNYVGSKGNNRGEHGKPFDSSFLTTGQSSNIGQRLVDNLDTIVASGDPMMLALGSDLSEYDSHCVRYNFRAPLVEALNSINLDYKYGPDKIPYLEMVQYAFGEGVLDGSFWDNGREPLIVALDIKNIPDELLEYMNEIQVIRKVANKHSAGLPSLEIGNHFILDIEKVLESSILVPWKLFKLASRPDGEDFVFLTSEASGELATLTNNSIANHTYQENAIEELGKISFGKKYLIKTRKSLGDDAEWIGIMLSSPTTEEIEEALHVLERSYADCGHIFNPAKTVIIPLSAEFVQTFARFGLYIPRDQIMMISSEKPRTVQNPLSFLASIKQVLLTKMSRGMNSDYARVVFLFLAREISKISLKRHKITKGKLITLKMKNEDHIHIDVIPQNFVRGSSIKTGSEEMKHYYMSTMVFALPYHANGCSWNPLCLGIIHTPAMFLYVVSNFDVEDQRRIMACYYYMRTRPLNDGTIKDGAADSLKLDPSEIKITHEDIFSKQVSLRLEMMKPFVDLGRHNGENAPRVLMKKGLLLESFMEIENNIDREHFGELFISKLNSNLPRVRMEDDEWVLNFDLINDGEPDRNYISENRIYNGLCPEYEFLLDAFGMCCGGSTMNRGMEKLRIIISRDPSLRNVVSPEEVMRVFEKHGISTTLDLNLGLLLMYRMGFTSEVASQLVECWLDPHEEIVSGNIYGALCDDFFITLNLVTYERRNKFEFPIGLSNTCKRIALVFSSQVSIYMTLRNEEIYYINGMKEKDKNLLKRIYGVIGIPRTFQKISAGARKRAGLQNEFLNDLMQAMTSARLGEFRE